MEDVDEVSSTTKEEGVGDNSVTTVESSGIEPEESAIGDSEEQSQNGRKRKSMAIDDDEEVSDVSGSADHALPTTTTTTMDVDEETGVESSVSPVVDAPPVTTLVPEVTKLEEPELEVELRVTYNKDPIPIRISLKKTVGDLKRMIEAVTKIAPELQKVLVKGIAKDDVVLGSLGLSAGSKVMVIGTKLDDVLAVNKTPTADELKADEASASEVTSHNWCSIPRHQKVIEKGTPDDAMPGILDCNDPLPDFPLSGMVNSRGAKLRLTFKLEADELWIGTKERTEKVGIGTIRGVVSQPIMGYEHYHILALQMGTTEASRVFIYWFPAQYIRALKDALGP